MREVVRKESGSGMTRVIIWVRYDVMTWLGMRLVCYDKSTYIHAKR